MGCCMVATLRVACRGCLRFGDPVAGEWLLCACCVAMVDCRLLLAWWAGFWGFWPLVICVSAWGGCCWPGLVGIACFGWLRVLECGAVWDGVFRLFGVPHNADAKSLAARTSLPLRDVHNRNHTGRHRGQRPAPQTPTTTSLPPPQPPPPGTTPRQRASNHSHPSKEQGGERQREEEGSEPRQGQGTQETPKLRKAKDAVQAAPTHAPPPSRPNCTCPTPSQDPPSPRPPPTQRHNGPPRGAPKDSAGRATEDPAGDNPTEARHTPKQHTTVPPWMLHATGNTHSPQTRGHQGTHQGDTREDQTNVKPWNPLPTGDLPRANTKPEPKARRRP